MDGFNEGMEQVREKRRRERLRIRFPTEAQQKAEKREYQRDYQRQWRLDNAEALAARRSDPDFIAKSKLAFAKWYAANAEAYNAGRRAKHAAKNREQENG